jgi:N-terminal half of MaoC dehydratase
MPIDPKFKGRSYGPYRYEVGLEKVREFAVAISTASLPYETARKEPQKLRAVYHDLEAAKATRHQGVIAPPTFCVNFAMAPFLQAVTDPELDINLPMLLHGEQSFEFLEVVRPGDVMLTTGVISELYEKAKKDFLICTTESKNQSGKLAVRAIWTAVIRQA